MESEEGREEQLQSDSNVDQAEKLPSTGSNETAGETSCIQFLLNDAEPCAKDRFNQTIDGDDQGLIRLYKLQRLAQVSLVNFVFS